MILATIHDACFCEENGYYYCNIIDYQMLSDFLKYFDQVVIVVRKSEMKEEYVKVDYDNISVHFVNSITSPDRLIFYGLKTFNTIKNAVLMSDAVYCRGINGIIAQRIAKKTGIPEFSYVGGCIYDSMKSDGSLYKRILAKTAFKFMRKSIANATHVIYVSNYLKKRYPTNGKTYTWSGVKINQINEDIKKTRTERILIEKDILYLGIIGYVGNRIKGIDTAIKALAKLDLNYHLKILGDGNHNELDLLINKYNLTNRVTFCGVLVGGNEVLSWLDDIDIYLQPSLTEGLPKATIEAMSRGCPVISSDVGGLPDIVNNRYLHKPGDYIELSQLIKQLTINKEEMIEISRHSFEMAEKYLPNVMENKLNKALEDIVAEVKQKDYKIH
jgi:glycosyltransferase involved in cell wall biosynthesis